MCYLMLLNLMIEAGEGSHNAGDPSSTLAKTLELKTTMKVRAYLPVEVLVRT